MFENDQQPESGASISADIKSRQELIGENLSNDDLSNFLSRNLTRIDKNNSGVAEPEELEAFKLQPDLSAREFRLASVLVDFEERLAFQSNDQWFFDYGISPKDMRVFQQTAQSKPEIP